MIFYKQRSLIHLSRMFILRRYQKPKLEQEAYNKKWEDIINTMQKATKNKQNWTNAANKMIQNKSQMLQHVSSNLYKLSQILEFCQIADKSLDVSFILLEPRVIIAASKSQKHANQYIRAMSRMNLTKNEQFWKTLSTLQQPQHFIRILKDSQKQNIQKWLNKTQPTKKIFGSKQEPTEIPEIQTKIQQIYQQSKDTQQRIQNHLLASQYSPQMLTYHLRYMTQVLKHNSKSAIIVIPRFQQRIYDWVINNIRDVPVQKLNKYLLQLSKHKSINDYSDLIMKLFQLETNRNDMPFLLSLFNRISIDNSQTRMQLSQISQAFMKMPFREQFYTSYVHYLEIYKIFCISQDVRLPMKVKRHCKNVLKQQMRSPEKNRNIQNGTVFLYLWCLALDDVEEAKKYHQQHREIFNKILKDNKQHRYTVVQERQYAQALLLMGLEPIKTSQQQQNQNKLKLSYLQESIVKWAKSNHPQAKIQTNLAIFPFTFDVVINNLIVDCLGYQHSFKTKLDKIRKQFAQKHGYKVVTVKVGDNIDQILRPLF